MDKKFENNGLSKKAKGIIAGVAGVVVIAGVAVPTAILATGKNDDVVNTPANTEFTITVPGIEGLGSYDITVNSGMAFGELKSLLKSPEGWQIEGCYKDPDNMDEDNKFDDGDVITEETKIYINYTRIKYTVTFKNYDGTVLYVAENIDYDNTGVEYEGETPTKVADDACTYAFDKWVDENNHDVNLNQRITSDITVYADFSATPINYELTLFADSEDLAALSVKKGETTLNQGDSVHIGETLTIGFEVTPTYEYSAFSVEGAVAVDEMGNEIENYTFNPNMIKVINGKRVYEGNFKVTSKGVKVTYKQKRSTYAVGELPEGVTITKIEEDGSETLVEEGTVLTHGDTIKVETTLKKGHHQYGEFSVPGTETIDNENNLYGVIGDVGVIFEQKANEYQVVVPSEVTVMVEKADGSKQVYTNNFNAEYGDKLSFSYDVKENYHLESLKLVYKVQNGTEIQELEVDIKDYIGNNQYVLGEFDGEAIVNGTNIGIEYIESVDARTVTFVNADGSILKTTDVDFNSVAVYDGDEPTKASEGDYNFSFAGWKDSDGNIVDLSEISITEDTTFTAYFEEVHKYLNLKLLSSGTYSVTDISEENLNADGVVNIPSTYRGVDVTVIRENAFVNKTSVTKVILPANIVSVENDGSAFRGCTNLTAIEVASENAEYYSVDGILYSNNSSQTKLVCVPAGKSLTSFDLSGINTIGKYAFHNSALTSLSIPSNIYSIGSGAFEGCANLSEITIESSNCYSQALGTALGQSGGILVNATKIKVSKTLTTSYNNSYLYGENYVIIDGDEYVEFYLADEYSDLEFEILEDNTYQVMGLSSENANATEVIIPSMYKGKAVTSIGKRAFNNCSSLTSITIPDSVTSIGNHAFYYCSKLTSITIPDSVTNIETYAFFGCSGLISVKIGNGVTSIGSNAFSSGLTRVDISDLGAWCNINFVGGSNPLYYAKNLYLNGELVNSLVISEDINEIKNYAFYNCTSLTSVYIPASVTTIGGTPFYGCSNSLKIFCEASSKPSGWSSYWNSGHTVIWNVKEYIETEDAIYYVDSNNDKHLYSVKNKELTEFTIAADTKIINSTAFDGCNNLTSLNVEAGSAYYSSLDGVLYNVDKTSLVRYPTGRQGDFTIPSSVETIEGYAFKGCSIDTLTVSENVTDIKSDAFNSCSIDKTNIISLSAWLNIDFENYNSTPIYQSENLYLNNVLVEELVIPEGTTSINSYAFYNCRSLTSVIIPDSVKTIDGYAFEECENIVSIDFGNGVETIEEAAFRYLYSLEEINLPNSLTYIGYDAFYDCDSVTTLVIPGSVTYIGEEAFAESDSLETLILQEGVEEIDCYAFAYSYALNSVTLPSTLTKIGYEAFYGCDELTSITIPGSVKVIEEEAFGDCDNLETVIIESGVEEIESNAFTYCENLTSITIPSTVTWIGDYAFYNCTSLTEIYIPASVTTIDGQPFMNCDSDMVIYCGVTEKPDDWDDNWNKYHNDSKLEVQWGVPDQDSLITQDGILYYLDQNGDKHLYKAESTDITTANIAADTKYIDKEAFYECYDLTSVTLPAGLISIGNDAFYECSLTSVTLPESLISLGTNAFLNCSITAITIPDSVTTIGNSAFECNSLKSVIIGNGVTSIGISAFCNNGGLTSVVIGNNVKTIGGSAFSGCDLTSITIPSSVTSIGSYAFSRCSSLTTINVDANNNYYCSEDGVLYNKDKTILICCPAGKTGTFIIPDSVTNIGEYAFYGCSGLTSITIGEGVTSIGSSAFSSCKKLSSITIPDSVTSIENYTFYGCSGLTSITIGEGVTSIGRQAFYSCSGLTAIYIPASVTTISASNNYFDSPFYNCSNVANPYLSNHLTIYCGATSKPSGWGNYWNIYYDGRELTVVWNVKEIIKTEDAVYYIDNNNDKHLSKVYNLNIEEYIVEDDTKIIDKYYPLTNPYNKLKTIKIPSSVTSIKEFAFSTYAGLRQIIVDESNEYYCSIDGVLYSKDRTKLIYCPSGKSGELTILDGVISIGRQAFLNSNLTSITIPNSVTSIESYAFQSCSNLISVTIGNSVTSIDQQAFYGCKKLTSIYIPSSVTTISATSYYNSPFYNCSSNLKIYCEASSKPNGWGNYWNYYSSSGQLEVIWNNGEEVTVGNTVYKMVNGDLHLVRAVSDEITSVNIINGTKFIDDEAFKYCSELTSVIIPNSVTSIGNSAFNSCSGLTSVTIPASVTSIGNSAFEYCENLTTLKINSKNLVIGSSAFSETGLTSVEFGTGNITIKDWAFSSINTLKNIYIPANVKVIEGEAFMYTRVNIYCELDTDDDGNEPDGFMSNWDSVDDEKYAKVYWNVTREEYEATING